MLSFNRLSALGLKLAIGFALASCLALGAKADDQFEPVRARIAKALVDHNIPSISVAVVREGQIVWEQGFGWADRENRVLASEHTMYSIASISKPITATGLMVLKQRKLIELDKPINDYLGEAKLRARVGDAAEATVRRVANHTSGLPLHYQFFYADESYRPPVFDETIRRYGNLVTVPGERFQYSNLGYGVLDDIIARVGGKKFGDFMREEVFLPLGMTQTSIDVGSGLELHQAIRYTSDGKRIPFYEFDHPGASAVYASAHDLARFAMFHMKEHLGDQKAILDDSTIEEMQVPTSGASGRGGYGIGWGSGEMRGHRMVSHTGGMPGVATMCGFFPAERVAIVVLTNTSSPMTQRITEMISAIVLPEQKEKDNNKDKEPKAATAPSNDSAPSGNFVPSAELIGRWNGHVTTPKGDTPLVLVIKDSGDVHVRLENQLETLLNGPSFQGGFLRGRFISELPTDDTRRQPYQIHLELKLREQILNGSATAITAPNVRGAFAITHWVELKREADKP